MSKIKIGSRLRSCTNISSRADGVTYPKLLYEYSNQYITQLDKLVNPIHWFYSFGFDSMAPGIFFVKNSTSKLGMKLENKHFL